MIRKFKTQAEETKFKKALADRLLVLGLDDGAVDCLKEIEQYKNTEVWVLRLVEHKRDTEGRPFHDKSSEIVTWIVKIPFERVIGAFSHEEDADVTATLFDLLGPSAADVHKNTDKLLNSISDGVLCL